jgi:uncharacterized protein
MDLVGCSMASMLKWFVPNVVAYGVLTCATTLVSAQLAPSPAVAPFAPSFECAKARGRTEKMICAERPLAALDRQVADLYALALAQATDLSDVKREQRRWLGDRDGCKEIACIESSYQQRLTQLTTQTGRFTTLEATSICENFVDADARAKALAAKNGTEDINNDGRADRASQCLGGTANIPCVEYLDEDDKSLSITPQGFQWMTYSAFGRAPLRLGGRTFTYYALDDALEQPAYVSYVTPTNREVRVCDFDTIVGSAVLEGGDEVCAAIEAADERIETLELTPVADSNAYATDRRDTQARALAKIDVDNDGLEEPLIEYVYSSGAARGCEINYFELLADDGQTLAKNSNAAAVQELQGLKVNGADGRSCGLNTNRLFRFGDKIYFESNATNTGALPHEVKSLEGTAVASVCTFERQIRTKIKTLY